VVGEVPWAAGILEEVASGPIGDRRKLSSVRRPRRKGEHVHGRQLCLSICSDLPLRDDSHRECSEVHGLPL
jgi:hypothetical protein